MNKTREIIIGLLLALLPVLGIVFSYQQGTLQTLEEETINERYRRIPSDRKINQNLVFLDINEDTLNEMDAAEGFGRWPWPRNVWARILEFIAAGEPKAVIFDVMFFGQNEGDEELGQVTEAFPFISHAVHFRNQSGEVTPVEFPENVQGPASLFTPLPGAEIREYNSAQAPPPEISSLMKRAHSVTYEGKTGQLPLLFKYNKSFYPGLSLSAFDSLQKIKSLKQDKKFLHITTEKGQSNVPLRNGMANIHFYSAPQQKILESKQTLSLFALLNTMKQLEDGVPEDKWLINPVKDFNGKVLIIGSTAPALFDIKQTPFGNQSGMYLHANLISNLSDGRFLQRIPLIYGVILAALLIFFSALPVLLSHNLLIRVLIPGVVLFLYMGAVGFLFTKDISLPMAPMLPAFPAAFLLLFSYISLTEGREKRKFKSAMGKYLSPDVLKEVMARGSLQAEVGHRKILTIMFTDIRSFTTLSEQKDAAVVVEILNEYLASMVSAIFDEEGTLDKYIGDAIMAFWGAPIEKPDHARRAVRAGFAMMRNLHQLHIGWKERNTPLLEMGVGIHTGEMIVGNIGSDQRLDYTVIGDNVNLGARLEGLTKEYGVSLLISETTFEAVREEFDCLPMDMVAVKGKSIPITIYAPIDPEAMPLAESRDLNHKFRSAFDAYKNRDFAMSDALYQDCAKLSPYGAKTALMMSKRSQLYIQSPPPPGWDGSFKMTTK